MLWTKQDIAKLKHFVMEGYSASMIGRELGRSRNSIIGKIDRERDNLDLDMPKTSNARPKRCQLKGSSKSLVLSPPRKGKSPRSEAVKPEDARKYDATSLQVTLENLAVDHCRFSTNQPDLGERYEFCGHACKQDSPYCLHHHQRTHQGGEVIVS